MSSSDCTTHPGVRSSQNFVVVVEDNFGKSCELEFDFQHDNGNSGTDETDDGGLPFFPRPIDSLVIVKPCLL